MALLDEKRDVFVVRIVYDGPPFSGKTTSLRALSADIHQPMDSPAEHDGRTLFFDWLDYTAGRFEGRSIRCQVVSVPGQRSLAERRRRLLAEADAVVFVADTGRLGIELSTKYARELAGIVARKEPPRPGIVVQANKRDVDDALELPAAVEAFREAGIEAAIMESTATSGAGVREAFLFGVRLALDRVKELSRRGLLRSGRPDVDSSRDLLEQLSDGAPAGSRGKETAGGSAGEEAADSGGSIVRERAGSAFGRIVSQAIARETDAPDDTGSRGATDAASDELPDPGVPSGMIWPPVRGRVIMQQALAGEPLQLETTACGDLEACSATGWQLHSRIQDRFEEQSEGRSALVNWARLHARNRELLSEHRCLVLSRSGRAWRLWQVVGRARSLDDMICADADGISSDAAAELLFASAKKLVTAADAFRSATVSLPSRLDTVAADRADIRFVGIMPGVDAEREGPDAGSCGVLDLALEALGEAPSVQRLLAVSDVAELVAKLRALDDPSSGPGGGLNCRLAERLSSERMA